MRIAVITDIHANIHALESITKNLKNESIDSIAFLGDLVMSGPRPKECYEILYSLNPKIWIQGNTDNWIKEIEENYVPTTERDIWIKSIFYYYKEHDTSNLGVNLLNKPMNEYFEYDGIQLAFCHGSPKSFSHGFLMTSNEEDINHGIQNEPNVIICGHTHSVVNIRYKNHCIVNFGSVSIPLDKPNHKTRFGIIEIEKNKINMIFKEIDFGIEEYFNDMKQNNFPGLDKIKEKYNWK